MKPLQSPFAHLSRTDLISPAELRLWAGSSLGQSIISTLRGSPVETETPGIQIMAGGKPVSVSALKPRKLRARRELQAEQWYKDRLAIQTFRDRQSQGFEILFGHKFSLADKSAGERIRRLADQRAPKRDWHFGTFLRSKLPSVSRCLPKVHSVRERLDTAGQGIAPYVHLIAIQASSKAIRRIACVSGVRPSQASQDDCLLSAIEKLSLELLRLSGSWAKAERLARPAYADRTLVSERKRRRWLYWQAYKAAYNTLQALPVGLTGRRGAIYLADVAEWGLGAIDTREAEERERRELQPIDRTRAAGWHIVPASDKTERLRQARALLWQRIVGTLRASADGNQQKKFMSAVRKWRTAALMLSGEEPETAARRSGLCGGEMLLSVHLPKILAAATEGRLTASDLGRTRNGGETIDL